MTATAAVAIMPMPTRTPAQICHGEPGLFFEAMAGERRLP
jgi:hypothetical protein